MGFSSDNIEHVKAMEIPLGFLADGQMVSVPGLALVGWRSDQSDKLFQVYVDGRLAGVTVYPDQRMLPVQCEETHTSAIEVVAVDPADKDVDHSSQLSGFDDIDGCHVMLSWPKRGTIAFGSRVVIYWDGGSGEIDYSEPVWQQSVWQGAWEKWGWGLDAFGRGDFGYSGTGAAGFGRGSFGNGEFGFDAEMQCFASEALSAGSYKFALRVTDSLGNYNDGQDSLFDISVDPLPEAATLALESYDDVSNLLVLDIS